MLFNSIEFLLFFPITIIIFFMLPSKAKNVELLIMSYLFYMGWNAKYSLLFDCDEYNIFDGSTVGKR